MAKHRSVQKRPPSSFCWSLQQQKSTNDGYVKQYLDQSSSIRSVTVDILKFCTSKADDAVNHISEIKIIIEKKTSTQLCGIKWTRIFSTLSLAQTNPFRAGYVLTRNRSNFICIIGASLWLYECQHYHSPLYTLKEMYFQKIAIFCQHTIYHLYPIGRQINSFATQIASEGNPASVKELDSDGNDCFILKPRRENQDPPAHFKPWEPWNPNHPNTFYAHTAGLYSSKCIKDIWKEFCWQSIQMKHFKFLVKQ